MVRLNFRKKSFVVFFIFTLIANIIYLSLTDYPSTLSGKLSLFFSYTNILFYILYLSAIVFLFLGRWYAWILGAVPSIYQIKLRVPDLISSIARGDTIGAGLAGIYLILPIIVVTYCLVNLVTDLKELEGKKIDFILGILFLILTSIFLSNLLPITLGGYLTTLHIIIGISIISTYYLTIFLWVLIEHFIIKNK